MRLRMSRGANHELGGHSIAEAAAWALNEIMANQQKMLGNKVNEQDAPSADDVHVRLRCQDLAARYWKGMSQGLAVALGVILVIAGVVGFNLFSLRVEKGDTDFALRTAEAQLEKSDEARQEIEAQLHVAEQLLEKLTATEIARLGGKVKLDRRKPRNPVVAVIWSRSKVNDSDLLLLHRFQQLESLDLAGTAVTDKGLESLNGLGKLGMLYLEDTKITDAGLKALANLPELWELNLENTQVTDAGLATLKDVKKLTSLSLGGTAITDQAIEHLSRLTRLDFLDIMDAAVTQRGCEALQRALPSAKVFHRQLAK